MTKKLLLADDSITIQKVIGIIFATEDFQLVVTDNGDDAYTKALEEFPDLVIADIAMPGKDGFELCEAIKSDSRLQHTAVLLLPGTFEHFDEDRAVAVGADGWINKPFESQTLLEKVAQLLEAEPIRLNQAEPPVAEESAPEPEAAATLAEDLGELPVEDSPTEEDSPEDIWDAVSFEEEDLALQGDSVPADEAFAAADDEVDFSAEQEVPAVPEDLTEASLDLSEEQPLELDTPLEEVSTEDEDEVLDLATEPDVEEIVDEVEDQEEILELSDEDILEEEPLPDLVEEEEPTVNEGPMVAEEPMVAAFADSVAEEPMVEEEQPLVEEGSVEPEFEASFDETEQSEAIDLQPEMAEDDGFYFDDSASEAPPAAVEAEPLAAEADEAPLAQAEQQLRQLSEEELKEVVGRVAGPIIEKLANEMLAQIAWEVVPDLAEAMILEEIRKIKQNV